MNIYPEETELIQALLNKRINVLAVGEAGLGKSTTAVKACEEAGLTFSTVNLSKQHDLIDLLGQYLLKGNELIWRDGKVTRAAQNGDVLILEELTMAEPTVLSALHGLFEDPAKLHTLEGDVKIHPEFRVIGTANPSWTNYEGVTDLNYAFEDRFAHIVFDFPKKEAFMAYVKPYKDVLKTSRVNVDDFYDFTQNLFSLYPDKLNYYMSLRGIKFFCMLLEDHSVKKSLDIAFFNKIPPSERDEVVDIVDNYIALY